MTDDRQDWLIVGVQAAGEHVFKFIDVRMSMDALNMVVTRSESDYVLSRVYTHIDRIQCSAFC